MLLVTAPAGAPLGELGGRLDQRLTLALRDQPLTEAAESLRQATGLTIVLAPALVASPPAVTLQVRDMPLGQVLTWLGQLTGVHIGYLHGAVYLSDRPVVGASSTRLYDVRDLALVPGDFPGPSLVLGEGGAQLLAAEPGAQSGSGYAPEALAELIKRVVTTR